MNFMDHPKEADKLERTEIAQDDFEAQMDSWFDGDLEPVCDLESPDVCEACD